MCFPKGHHKEIEPALLREMLRQHGPDEKLLGALRALYGPDAGQQAAASQWLHQYAGTPDSWGGAVQLLAGDDVTEDMKFFGANLLLTKVRRDWKQLGDWEQQAFVVDSIRSAGGRVGRGGGGERHGGIAVEVPRLCRHPVSRI